MFISYDRSEQTTYARHYAKNKRKHGKRQALTQVIAYLPLCKIRNRKVFNKKTFPLKSVVSVDC